ncbi:unnamed protein product, partial [Symbiodinium necroappetens]
GAIFGSVFGGALIMSRGRFLMGIGIGLATRSYLSEVVLPEQRGGVLAFCLRLPRADGRVHCAGAAKVNVADKWIQPFVILLAVLEEISSLRRPGAEKCLETYPSGRGSLEELSKDADTAEGRDDLIRLWDDNVAH